jgi:SAM-dependent methyltransferase
VLPSPSTPARDAAFDAYEPFAGLYDLFTAHHDYGAWITSIELVAQHHGLVGRRLLDVACGTGKSLVPWVERGYLAAGCDLSPAMLAEAKRKVRGRARLFCADMRALPATGHVDLVTCLDDAVNYLLEPSDLPRAFACAAAHLDTGGVYVFDVNSLRTYSEEFSLTQRSTSGDWDFTWQGHGRGAALPAEKRRATITARRACQPAGTQVCCSTHVQRHHPIPLVAEALASVGMPKVAVHGQHRDGSIDPEFDELTHAKALVVARKV